MRSAGIRLGPLIALSLAAASLAGPQAVQAEDIYPMYFPVIGSVQYTDTWGAARAGGRTHDGTDIMTFGVKGLPVVAVASGTVGWMQDEQGGKCCAMALHHDDGWTSWYIHLNNDTPGTDDGQGWGFAPGIETGVHVEAGQLIGFVGDSGNAEDVAPHLHFELHQPDPTDSQGLPINPYSDLLAATILTEPLTGAPTAFTPPFRDDDGLVHEPDIILLYELGITNGCDTELFCPHEGVTRGQMAAFLNRALVLPPAAQDYFSDDNGSIFEADINAIAFAGITLGCDPGVYCPDAPIFRAQMASFLVRAFGLAPTAIDFFSDDAGSIHEPDINSLAASGLTYGCDEALYCPDGVVTRGQMASFIARSLAVFGGF